MFGKESVKKEEEVKKQLPVKIVYGNFFGTIKTTVAAQENKANISDRTQLFRTDFVEIVLDRKNHLLLVCWLRPVVSNEYRHGIQETSRLFLNLGLERLLINNCKMGVLTMEDQGWLSRFSVEIISQSKLQRLAIVSSFDILQQLTNEVLDSRVKEATPPFDTQYFLTEQDALDWLLM